MYYVKLEKEYAQLKYELGNMKEYVMHDVKNYQYTPTMRYVMNVVLYASRCIRKEDGLLRSVLRVIDVCYLPVELVCLYVCMI